MQPAGRLGAAIEVLSDIEARKRPASEALKDWGLGHRFAGSGDRAAIGNLVFDALRMRASAAALMEDDSPRAIALRTLASRWQETPGAIAALCDGSGFAPASLTASEQAGLARTLPPDAPAHIRGDFPEWLSQEFMRAFGAEAAEEGAALALRAPVDLRVNTLKASRDKVLKALARYHAAPTLHAPSGIRIALGVGPSRSPKVEAEAGHGKGWFEVQDEGSQLATLLTGAKPRSQVIDLCAGGGGKTLGLAALMGNTGQLYAYDADRQRLRPIFERLKRAGARNVQVLEAGSSESLAALQGKLDLVVIDAPCSGSGVWRRRPDAKWRLSPQMLETRLAEQRAVLDTGAGLVRPGGRLAYITCSVLPSENEDQVEGFLTRHPDFESRPWAPIWENVIGTPAPALGDGQGTALLMSPKRLGTDGFFVSVMERRLSQATNI